MFLVCLFLKGNSCIGVVSYAIFFSILGSVGSQRFKWRDEIPNIICIGHETLPPNTANCPWRIVHDPWSIVITIWG